MLSIEETGMIVGLIKAAYPNYNVDDMAVTIKTFRTLLSDYTYDEVEKGLHRFITTSNSAFAPSIGQIIDNIMKNRQQASGEDEVSEKEIWSMVLRAIRNGTYEAEEEFNKLPSLVQKAVGTPEVIRAWAAGDEDSLSYIESEFMKSYRTIVARDKENQKIPQYVKDLFITKDDVKKIEGGNQE